MNKNKPDVQICREMGAGLLLILKGETENTFIIKPFLKLKLLTTLKLLLL